MALLTDDCDIKINYLRMLAGNNGDYYVNIITNDKDGDMHEESVRVAMSGGTANTRVKLAVAELFRAMEEQKLNDFPDVASNKEKIKNLIR